MFRINFDCIYNTKKLESTLNKMLERGYSLKSIGSVLMCFEKKDTRLSFLKYAVRKCDASSLDIHELPEGWSKCKTLGNRVSILMTTNESSPEVPDVIPSQGKMSTSAVMKSILDYSVFLLFLVLFVYFAVISKSFWLKMFFVFLASSFFGRELIDTLFVFNKLKASRLISAVYRTCSAITLILLAALVVICLLMQFDVGIFE